MQSYLLKTTRSRIHLSELVKLEHRDAKEIEIELQEVAKSDHYNYDFSTKWLEIDPELVIRNRKRRDLYRYLKDSLIAIGLFMLSLTLLMLNITAASSIVEITAIILMSVSVLIFIFKFGQFLYAQGNYDKGFAAAVANLVYGGGSFT